jgi:hypothetical protein
MISLPRNERFAFSLSAWMQALNEEPTPPPVSEQRRALIVDDEIIFAINLEADMHPLGFDICDLAANGQQASKMAMSNQPDLHGGISYAR